MSTDPTDPTTTQAAFESLTSAAGHWLEAWLLAGRAATAVMGLPTDAPADDDPGSATAQTAYERPDWTATRTVDAAEDIRVGDVVTFSKAVTDEDIAAFARVSGDTNRLHLDPSFAAGTRFDHRIAHGTLVSGLISAALARLPGVTVYLSQELTFLAPVDVGAHLTARCEVVEDLGEGQYRLTTHVLDADDEKIIDGEAVVLVDPLPSTVGG